MRRLVAVSLIISVLALGACRSPETVSGAPDPSTIRSLDGEIRVARVGGGIRLTNGTSRGLAYIVRNPAWLGLVALCVDTGPNCIRLASGASVVVPDREVLGHAPGAHEAQVTLWRVEPDPAGGFQAVIVKEVTIRL